MFYSSFCFLNRKSHFRVLSCIISCIQYYCDFALIISVVMHISHKNEQGSYFLYSFQVYIINCLNLVWEIPCIGPLVPLHMVTHNKLISSTLSLKLKVEVWWCLEFGTKTCEDPSKMHWMINESVHESLHWMDRGSNPIWNEYVSELANFVYKWTQKEIWSNLRDVRAIWKNRPKNQNVCKKRLWIGIVEKTKVNLRQLVKVRVNDQGKESQWSIVVKGSV